MKRLISIIGSIMGIFVLIAIMVFAFNVVKPGNSPVTSQISTQIIETAAQPTSTSQGTEEPYPPIFNPDLWTEEPYPGPSHYDDDELLIGTETPVFTPTSYPSPTVTPTPVNLPTLEDPLPAGLKMVYAETDGENGITNIWLVNLADLLNERKLLVTIKHKIEYEVYGRVSPDGRKIAYKIIPTNASQKSARTNGNEIWVMNIDGSEPRMLSDQIGFLGMWAPDSKSIIASRFIPIENNPSDPNEWREELYLIDVNSLELKLLITSENFSDFQMTGWSGDGQVFYITVRTTSSWELWAIDISSGSNYLQVASPIDTDDIPVLSPDGNWLLFQATLDGQRHQILLGIDGKQRKDISQISINDENNSLPITLFSANSQNLLFFNPSELGQQPNLEKIGINDNNKQSLPIISTFIEPGNFYELRGWSPDETWAVMQQYPTNLYFLKIDSGEMIKMPMSLPSNWLTPFGWINQ